MHARQRFLIRALVFVVGVTGVLFWYASIARIANDWHEPVADMDFGRDLRGSLAAGELAADRNADAIYERSHPAYRDVDAANYFYPQWFAMHMTPFSAIPFPAVFVVWSLLGGAILFWAVRYLKVPNWPAVGLGVATTVAAVICVWYGQTSLVMVGLLAVAVTAAVGGQHAQAGIGFALLGFKPHLLVGFGVAWLLDLRRSWRTLMWIGVTTFGLIVVSAIWLPGSWVDFATTILESEPLATRSREVSLTSAAHLLFGDSTVLVWGSYGVAALAVLAGLVYADRRTSHDLVVMSTLAIFASLLVALHSLSYDWLLLIVALGVLALSGRLDHASIGIAGLGLAASLAIGFPITDAMLDATGFAVHLPPLTLFGVFAWLVVRLGRDAEGVER